MSLISKKVDDVIARHFRKYFKEQMIEPQQNEWSALRQSVIGLILSDRESYSQQKVKEALERSYQDRLNGGGWSSKEEYVKILSQSNSIQKNNKG